MSCFDRACSAMKEQLGHDVQIALATCADDNVSVRIVNGYYRDGAIYVVTHLETLKMKQILGNPNVSLCRELTQVFGTGENLGNPRAAVNHELATELREVFIAFYDRHVNEADPGCCILKINLTKAIVFTDEYKYVIDYQAQTAEEVAFRNTIVS